MINYWTKKEDEILKEKYSSCKSIKEVMVFLPNRCYESIRSRAQFLKIKIKKLPQHNRSYFDNPNEENCAWAGFLAADGCISDNNRLYLHISRKDKDHIISFISATNFTGNIFDYERKYDLNVKKYDKVTNYKGIIKTSTIQIQCPEWANKLKEYWNITPRKSKTLLPPNLNDIRLIISYISGLIDGDGWITVDNYSKNINYSICIMGSRQTIEWIKITFDTLVPNSCFANLKPTISENIYEYKISGAKVYWISKIFLSLNIPRLNRKWDKLIPFIKNVEENLISKRMKTSIKNITPSFEILNKFNIKNNFI